jgi:hypothetical protein
MPLYTNPPPKIYRALQSVLGVLGQGVDLGKQFGKNKVCWGLIYTPVPIAAYISSAAACARIVSAPVPARARSHPCTMAIRPCPGHASALQWFCALQLPSAPDLGGRARSRFCPKSPRPIPCIRALSHWSAPAASVPHLPISALSHQPALDVSSPHTSVRTLFHSSVPSSICPRPFQPIIAHRVRALTNGRTHPTATATCMRS